MARESEILVKSNKELTVYLRLIHNFLFGLNQASILKIDRIKDQLVAAFNPNMNKKHKSPAAVIENLLTNAAKEKVLFTSNPEVLFKKIHDENIASVKPFIGEIDKDSLLFNNDLVMGIKCSVNGLTIDYRLDFDDKKGLHLNMSFLIKDITYLYTLTHIHVSEQSRFYVPPTTRDDHNKDISKKSKEIQERMIKLKFDIKMTSYCLLNQCHSKPSENNVFKSYMYEAGLEPDNLLDYLNKDTRDDFINQMMHLYADKAEATEAAKTKSAKNTEGPNLFIPLKAIRLPTNDFDSESDGYCNSPRWN